jgi:PAS domain S-box-containing protein
MSLIDFNLDGIITDVSHDICMFLGYDNHNLKGNHISMILDKSYYKSDKFRNLWSEIREGKEQKIAMSLIKKDGTKFEINAVFKPVIEKESGLLYRLKKIEMDFDNTMEISKENHVKDEFDDEIDSETAEHLKKLIFENRERLKELAAINQTTKILKEGKSLEETLQQISMILPKAWQYPDYTAARIIYNKKEFKTPNFIETPWVQRQVFETVDRNKGSVEIYYLKSFPNIDEGPFLKE